MKKIFLLVCLIFCLLPLTNFAQQTACKIYAYAIDNDPAGLNVRSGAGRSFRVLGKILPDENGVLVDVVAANGSWLKIEKAETVDGETAFAGSGWVFASMLGTSTRMKTKLYTGPSLKSKSLANLPAEEELKLLSCRGEWAKVQYGGKQGWLAPGSQCGNPVTTCP